MLFWYEYLSFTNIERLYKETRPLIGKAADLEDFIKCTVQRMDRSVLQNTMSLSIDGIRLERMWQMEFYRAALTVLSDANFISPDVGTIFDCKGYLDFYVNDSLKWAIELLREGNRMKQHEERFQSGKQLM